jgi:hypothetical protein
MPEACRNCGAQLAGEIERLIDLLLPPMPA